MTTNRKLHLKSEFALFPTSSILFNFILFVKSWRNFLGLNPKGPYLILEKESFCAAFTYSIKRAREIRKFHVAVLQRRLKSVQKRRAARTRLSFCLSKPLAFLLFLLLSPSSLLEFLIVVIQKVCYQGNVMSPFSLLLLILGVDERRKLEVQPR